VSISRRGALDSTFRVSGLFLPAAFYISIRRDKSYYSNQPVEIRLLQNYDANVQPDEAHDKPVTAPFAQGESTISLLTQINGAGTVPSYNAGSMNFAASQVAFHTLEGVPFTVTYTVDAEAESN
jgi:hypothetical protein